MASVAAAPARAKVIVGHFGSAGEAERPPTLREYAARWSRVLDGQVHARTAANYRGLLALHVLPVLGDVSLVALTRVAIRDVLVGLVERGKSKSTVHNVLTVISSLCAAAIDDGLLHENPAVGAVHRLFRRQRRGHGRAKARSRGEVAALLAAAQARAPSLYPLFLTMVETGLRVGEALGLQASDLDVPSRTLRIGRQWVYREKRVDEPKFGEYRTIEIPTPLVDYLAARIAAAPTAPWLFASPRTGRPWCVMYVSRTLRRFARELGLPRTTAHALRHTYATIALEESRDVAYVSRQLGHASMDITLDLYAASAVLRHPRALLRLDEAVHGRESRRANNV